MKRNDGWQYRQLYDDHSIVRCFRWYYLCGPPVFVLISLILLVLLLFCLFEFDGLYLFLQLGL